MPEELKNEEIYHSAKKSHTNLMFFDTFINALKWDMNNYFPTKKKMDT